MIAPAAARTAIWVICLIATAGVIVRPFRLPEALWAVAGALLLVILGLVSPGLASAAIGKGADVYLFLIGMMLLSETARQEGLFDWVAVHAVNAARGSTARLFALVFGVGVVVTTFLSNDATAVVLTPAVYAAARKARADPLPMLFACALIANAASFVLPISNPANLVLYGGHMPPLGAWLASFTLPSVAAIGATFVALRLVERDRLSGVCERSIEPVALSNGGAIALGGIIVTAVVLVAVSAFDIALGLPTCVAGVVTTAIVCVGGRQSPAPILRGVSWSVLPLVAGLFVLVEALVSTGLIDTLAAALRSAAAHSVPAAAALSGTLLAFVSNLMNNLPAGLIASTTIAAAVPPRLVTDALLIGVDLGPNLSITGSLATILWLTAIRREGLDVGFWRFLKVGAATMPPALILALGVRIALG
ncbi:Arsenic transporter [Sphingomonas sp. EC-HK361]|uniref:arsenic transporter n=1 Tax=Sphingomonas sp. EC-HK361 TaxID=2038397 RepID=UPI00125564A0|nr:arsenic transporter [Sphingomonas sp. EC-HK361]VVT14805.1 Arsenic transporter [Sphingomonas sp. EC-HK361]